MTVARQHTPHAGSISSKTAANTTASSRPRTARASLTAVLLTAGTAALTACASGDGHVVSRLPATSAAAPPPPPLTLPSAETQQQRYNEIDKRALDASESALAAQEAARLTPAPNINLYEGLSPSSRFYGPRGTGWPF